MSKYQSGGQFAPQNRDAMEFHSKIMPKMRGYGWSEKTIRQREDIPKVEFDRLVDKILYEGHAVKTRAKNECAECHRVTEAGEVVLGIVESRMGGSDRYYMCLECVKWEIKKDVK